MAQITWNGPDYIGANARRSGAGAAWSEGSTTATFSGTAIPTTATNIKCSLHTNYLQDGRNSSRYTLDGIEHSARDYTLYTEATIPITAPSAGASSKDVVLKHTPDDTSGSWVGSTWELKNGNYLIITYDDSGTPDPPTPPGPTQEALQWPEGAVCRLNMTDLPVYTDSCAAIQCTPVPGAFGYEVVESLDGVNWTMCAQSNPATVFPSMTGPKAFMMRAISSSGQEALHAPWLNCNNLLFYSGTVVWPAGAVCRVNDSDQDVYSSGPAYVSCAPAERAVGYEVQESADGTNWTYVGNTNPCTVMPDTTLGTPRSYRMRGLSSAGEGFHTEWLYSVNLLYGFTLQAAPSGARAVQAPYNPEVYVVSWNDEGHPANGINNEFIYYRLFIQDVPEGNPAGAGDLVLWQDYVTDRTTALPAPPQGMIRKLLLYSMGTRYEMNGPCIVSLSDGKGVPLPPTVVTFENDTATVTAYLKWYGAQPGTNNPITGYQVQVNTNGQGWTDLPGHTNGNVGLVETIGVTPPPLNQTALYRVRTVATDPDHLYSEWKEADTSLAREVTRPGAPTSVWMDAYSAPATTTLRWAGAIDGTNNPIIGYTIQYSDSGGPWTDYTSVGPVTFCDVPVPAMNVTRQFRVRADAGAQGVDLQGNPKNCSDFSSPSPGLVAEPGKPTPPTQITFSLPIGATTTMTWTGHQAGLNNPISGFAIQRRAENGAWTRIATARTASLTIDVPDDGQVYYYRIATLGQNGVNSAYSQQSEGISRAGAAPTKPGTPYFKYNPCSVEQIMSWSPSVARGASQVTGYEIQISKDGKRTWQAAGTSQNPLSIISPPTSIQPVYYRVRAIGSVSGQNSAWSDPSQPLMNARLIFEDDSGVTAIWKLTDDVDVHFVPKRKQYVSLLAYSGDNVAHAWWVSVKDNRQPRIMNDCFLTTIFTHADGTIFAASGYGDGNIVKVCFPYGMMDHPGLYHGVLAAEKDYAHTELEHIILKVEER